MSGNTITINNLMNPYYAGTFTVDLMVYGDNANWATNLVSNTVSFTTKTLTSPSAMLLLQKINEPTVMEIKFTTDSYLASGNRDENDVYKTYTEIEITM